MIINLGVGKEDFALAHELLDTILRHGTCQRCKAIERMPVTNTGNLLGDILTLIQDEDQKPCNGCMKARAVLAASKLLEKHADLTDLEISHTDKKDRPCSFYFRWPNSIFDQIRNNVQSVISQANSGNKSANRATLDTLFNNIEIIKKCPRCNMAIRFSPRVDDFSIPGINA